MNKKEFLFQLLQEECAELIQAASKINRFGLEFQSGTKEVNNKNDFIVELNDVYAVLSLLVKEGVLTEHDTTANPIMILNKCAKIEKYMKVSHELGHLQ